jgi:hypothetical protein
MTRSRVIFLPAEIERFEPVTHTAGKKIPGEQIRAGRFRSKPDLT